MTRLRKITAISLILLFTGFAYAQSQEGDTVSAPVPAPVADAGDVLNNIHANTDLLIQITTPRGLDETQDDDWLLIVTAVSSLVVAGLTLIFTCRTFAQQKKTTKNTEGIQQLQVDMQNEIFKDLIRHLYRNFVIVSAMYIKIGKNGGFSKVYPSEEHLLKLKVLDEDFNFYKFSTLKDHYKSLHELSLGFRNYNVEVDIILSHLKDKAVAVEEKETDFDTLFFKSPHLTRQICKVMNEIRKDSIDDNVLISIIRKTSKLEEGTEPDVSKFKAGVMEFSTREREPNDRWNYYDKNFELTDILNFDINEQVADDKRIKILKL